MSMDSSLGGKPTKAREEQERKAETPIEVREEGNETEAKEEQERKADSPREVRPSPNVTEAREEQFAKAEDSMISCPFS